MAFGCGHQVNKCEVYPILIIFVFLSEKENSDCPRAGAQWCFLEKPISSLIYMDPLLDWLVGHPLFIANLISSYSHYVLELLPR